MPSATLQSSLNCQLPPPCPRLRIVAVVLAAGTASRMGGRPKCLLQRDGQTLLNRLLTALEDAGIDETVLVLGHKADIIQASLGSRAPASLRGPHRPAMHIHQLMNPQPTDGQNSSLHLGLAKAQSLQAQWLMVALADQPLLDAADLQALIAAVKAGPADTQMLQPWVDNQPGNPVMLSQKVMSDLLAHSQGASFADGTSSKDLPGGKEWRQRHPQQVHQWMTSNPHYKVDMDTPEDIAALQTKYGVALTWDTPI
ncbi:MAG: Nicotine blue oxidoreductase [Pseudomonadota bacterium]